MYEPPARDATPQRSSAAERDGSPASVWPPMQLWTDPPARSEQAVEDPNAGRGQLSEQFWRRSEARNGGQWEDEAYDGRGHEADVVPLPSAQVSPAPAAQEPPSVEGTGRAAVLRDRPRPLGPPPATAASLGMEDAPTGEFPRWGTGLVPPLEDVAEVSGEAAADALSEPTLHRLNGPVRDPGGGTRTGNGRTLPAAPSMVPLPPGPTPDDPGTWTDPPPRGIAAVPDSGHAARAERPTVPGGDDVGTPPVPAPRSNGRTPTDLPARATGQPVPDPDGRGHGVARNSGATIPAARDGGTRSPDRFPRRTEPSIPHPTDPASRDAASAPLNRPRRTEPVGPHLTDPPAALGESRRRAGGRAPVQVGPAGRTVQSGQRAPLEPVRQSDPEQPDGGAAEVSRQPDATSEATPVARLSDPLTGPLPTGQPAVPEGLIAGPVPGWLELMRKDAEAQAAPASEDAGTVPESAGPAPEGTASDDARSHTVADGRTAPSTGTPPGVTSAPSAGAAPTIGAPPDDWSVAAGAPAAGGWTGPPFVGGAPLAPVDEPAEYPSAPNGRQERPAPQPASDPLMAPEHPQMEPVVAPEMPSTAPAPVPAPWSTGPAPAPVPAPDVSPEAPPRAEPAPSRQTPPTDRDVDSGEDTGAATVLTAVRELPGVRDAELVGEPGRQQVLRLDLVATVDPHTVGRQAAALLKDQLGLHAAVRARSETAGRYLPQPQRADEEAGSEDSSRGRRRSDGADRAAGGYGESSVPAVSVEQVQVVTAGLEAAVEVGLAVSGVRVAGRASGPAHDWHVLRAAVTATTEALGMLLAGRARLALEYAELVPAGPARVAVVSLLLLSSSGTERVAGAAPVRGEAPDAAVLATIAAIQHRLADLLDAAAIGR